MPLKTSCFLFLLGFAFLLGLGCECCYGRGTKITLVGRAEKSRVKGTSWVCMSEDLGCMGSIVCHCHSYSAISDDKEVWGLKEAKVAGCE